MSKIKSNKSGIKIAIVVATFSIALMLFQYIYIGIVLKKEAEQDSKEIALHTAQEIANSVEVYFRDALTVTQTFARNFLVYRQNKIPRTTIYNLMRGSLSLSNNFLAIWTMWEPNAYDNKDRFFINDNIHDSKGSFSIAYYYQGNEIKRELNDTSDFYEDYYTIPKKYKLPVILDPFYYQYHGNSKVYFETSLISPIIENNKFLGVIGIDIDMYSLQAKYNKIRVYNEGFISLLSNSGNIVTHKFPQFIERNISNYTQNDKISILDSLKSSKSFFTESYSAFSGEKVLRYYFPININYMAAPWYIMIEIPQRKIFEEINSIKTISTVFLTASLILLLYLIFNIIDRRKKEKFLLETIRQVESSETRIKEAYNLLSNNEKILEAIFNQTFSFVGLLSTDGLIMRVNKPALEFINKKESDIIGKPFIDSPWWKDLPKEKVKLTHALKLAESGIHSTFETVHYNKEGKPVTFLFSVKPIFDTNQNILFILPEGIDITNIKEAQLQLKKYQEHLEELVHERTQEIQQLNQELLSSNEELHTVNERTLEQKEELTQALEQLKSTQEQLIISEKMASLGLFTAGIAHEINNPVNFISAGAQSLFEQINILKASEINNNPAFQSFIATSEILQKGINTGIERTTDIISSLRNYSGNNSEIFIPYSIEKCIKDSLIILHNKYKGRITITENYEEQLAVECIPGKINQVFVNLISNAIDAIENKGEIHISSKKQNEYLEIEIRDTGEGIATENLQKLFDPFFSTKPVGKGVGLGLYIVYSIIEQHKGKIDVMSQKGKGCVFTILLPLKQS